MSKAVWKYKIPFGDTAEVQMKDGAVVLSASLEDERLLLPEILVWALVDIDAPDVTRVFYVRGTGHEVQDYVGQYIATLPDGRFIWHLFEAATS